MAIFWFGNPKKRKNEAALSMLSSEERKPNTMTQASRKLRPLTIR